MAVQKDLAHVFDVGCQELEPIQTEQETRAA